jgi:hypothetical protein
MALNAGVRWWMTGLAIASSTWGGIAVGPGAMSMYFFIGKPSGLAVQGENRRLSVGFARNMASKSSLVSYQN